MTTPRLLLPGSALGVVLVALSSTSCSGSGGSGPPSASIGGSGGRLSIDSGPLAGTFLDVPAGAVGADVVFRVESLDEPMLDAYHAAIGPAIRLMPEDLPFAVPAELQMPFSLDLVAGRAGPNDVRLMVWTTDPANADYRTPTALDQPAGLARTTLTGTVAVMPVAVLQDPVLPIVDWLPLEPDTLFEYDDGSTLSVEISASEPHLEGLELFRLAWDTAASPAIGEYWRRTPGGQTIYHGSFDLGTGVQTIAIDPVGLLLAEAQVNALRRQAYRFEFYESIANPQPTSWGETDLEIALELISTFQTPLRSFENVVRMTLLETDGAGGTGRQRDYWLARDVGIVAYRLSQFGSTALLTRGELGGTPLLGD